MTGSPLGKYAAPAAAVASLTIIGVALLGLVFGTQLGIAEASQSQLNLLAALAAGALFGSSVAVNGYKAPIEAHAAQISKLRDQVVANRTAITAVGNGAAAAVFAAADAAAAAVQDAHV